MSALADFAHKFGTESRELKIGQSFFNDADSCFHTIRYDFVPASVDPNKPSAVDFGGNGKVTVTMPNLEGSGTGRESVYQGQRKPHMSKECVLIFNPETGDIVLERLNTSMIVKKARLRQEDLPAKAGLASLNNGSTSHKSPIATNGSSQSSNGPGSHSHAKSSIYNDKTKNSSSLKSSSAGQSMPNMAAITGPSKLPNKTSPPLSSSSATSSISQSNTPLRSNGLAPKTPSPPSMPIFAANNKGSMPMLVHSNGGTLPSASKPAESSDWNGNSAKAKSPTAVQQTVQTSPPKPKQRTSTRTLSEESSSDSDVASDDDSESSSQSSGSSSDDEDMVPVSATEPKAASTNANALSMPSFLSSISAPSRGPNYDSSSNHAKSPQDSIKKAAPPSSSALSLSLSEDSDSDDDGLSLSKGNTKLSNGNDLNSNKTVKGQSEPAKAAFLDSMPKFNLSNGNGGPVAPSSGTGTSFSSMPTMPTMPKFSQLSQDLQLSESGSDSDDSD